MKTRTLIIIAAFLVLIPWIHALDYDPYNGIRVEGVTTSATVVMILTITFSFISWFLLSWASKNIKSVGIPLSIITGTSLILPFMGVLGPMAAIIVGVVAGFVAFMLQKKMTDPTQNKSLIIAAITITASYFVLIMIVLAAQTNVIWDTGNGIGAWTGTPEGMERGYIGGGSIDLDPDLSPSYAYDFAFGSVMYHNLISLMPMILFFTLPYIPLWLIEKYKKIPARSLQKLFLGSTAIYWGGSLSILLLTGIVNLIFNPSDHFGSFGTFIFTFGLLGIPVLALGIVLLYKSPIIRRLLNR